MPIGQSQHHILTNLQHNDILFHSFDPADRQALIARFMLADDRGSGKRLARLFDGLRYCCHATKIIPRTAQHNHPALDTSLYLCMLLKSHIPF
jgi:hypothetical protein